MPESSNLDARDAAILAAVEARGGFNVFDPAEHWTSVGGAAPRRGVRDRARALHARGLLLAEPPPATGYRLLSGGRRALDAFRAIHGEPAWPTPREARQRRAAQRLERTADAVELDDAQRVALAAAALPLRPQHRADHVRRLPGGPDALLHLHELGLVRLSPTPARAGDLRCGGARVALRRTTLGDRVAARLQLDARRSP